MMKATWTLAIVVSLFVPPAAAAANKEHQQMMAEIRMLQEQQQQLQQMLGGLAETLKTITAKIDNQGNLTQKAFADQNLVLNNIGETVRVLREKADDTNVRISTMTQELQALRQTVASLPAPAAVMPGGEPAATDPSVLPPTGASPNPPPTNISPTRMYDQAYADFAGGHYDLAVEGFEAFIRTFPTSPNADDARLNIGNAWYNAGKYAEASAALQKVISDYPKSNSVPAAYYKLGLTYEALKQPEQARQAYETLIREYQGSDPTLPTMAGQALERLKRRED